MRIFYWYISYLDDIPNIYILYMSNIFIDIFIYFIFRWIPNIYIYIYVRYIYRYIHIPNIIIIIIIIIINIWWDILIN